jgi:hypothetical protein
LRLPAPVARAIRPAVALSVLGLGLRLAQIWLESQERTSQAPARALVPQPLAKLPAKAPMPQPLSKPPARQDQRALPPPTINATDVPQTIVVIQRTIQVWVTTIWWER